LTANRKCKSRIIIENEILNRLGEVEKHNEKLKLIIVLLAIVNISGIITFAFNYKANANIIRAKGIVIEDKDGRDRILIGSPIPL
jgi:hypothetical protein